MLRFKLFELLRSLSIFGLLFVFLSCMVVGVVRMVPFFHIANIGGRKGGGKGQLVGGHSLLTPSSLNNWLTGGLRKRLQNSVFPKPLEIKDLIFWDHVHHPLCVMHLKLWVLCHMSCVTHLLSHISKSGVRQEMVWKSIWIYMNWARTPGFAGPIWKINEGKD